MNGLIISQISITGNLEKDQQLLVFGIGGLIALIVLAMIVILVIVIIRRSKRNRVEEQVFIQAVAESSQPIIPEIKVELPPIVEKIVEQPTPVVEEKVQPAILPEKKQEEHVKPIEEKKSTVKPTISEQKAEDKLEEIRKRLEEIRGQKNTGPTIVLPKIEATKTEKPAEVAEGKSLVETKIEEIPQLLEPESNIAGEIAKPAEALVEQNAHEEPAHTVYDEGVMKDVISQESIERTPEIMNPIEFLKVEREPEALTENHRNEMVSNSANGKFLPMKKLTFAEWVDLFKQ